MKGKLSALFLLLLLPTALTAQLITRNFVHSGLSRKYDLQLPASWTPGSHLPLVFDLHYLGGDARDEDSLTRFFPVADTAGFIICHPWGSGTNWNAGFLNPYTAGAKDVDFIRTVIDSIDSEFGLDRTRVYVTGMGQGGFMAHRLACELSDEITAIAAVGASMADSAAFYCSPTRPVPVMIIHGTADSVIPYATANPGIWPSIPDLVQFWLNKNGCPSAISTTQSLPNPVNEGSAIVSHRYPCTAGSEILLYEVQNGGFSWPGAQDSLPNSGIINQDINASEHIWQFFRRWSNPDAVGIRTTSASTGLAIHPNPARERCTVSFPEVREAGQLRVLNPAGQELRRQDLAAGTNAVRLDLSDLAAGIYWVMVEADGGRWFGKVVRG